MGKESYKRGHSVSFALTKEEQARLNAILSKSGQPLQRFVNHFFDCMAFSGFEESLLLPPVLPVKTEEAARRIFTRLADETYAVMQGISQNRVMPLAHLIRIWCVRSIELCERHGMEIMPEKEEVWAWLEERASEPPRLSLVSRILNLFRGHQ